MTCSLLVAFAHPAVLPPSAGQEAAALLGAILRMAVRTLANRANVAQLRLRAVAYMDVLQACHASLAELEYKQVVEEYRALLEVGAGAAAAVAGPPPPLMAAAPVYTTGGGTLRLRAVWLVHAHAHACAPQPQLPPGGHMLAARREGSPGLPGRQLAVHDDLGIGIAPSWRGSAATPQEEA